MVRIRSLLIATALLGFAGCFGATFTRTGPVYPPRQKDCAIEVITVMPTGSFIEIGAIDVSGGAHTDLVYFKNEITPYACEAGGDAVVVFSTGGVYHKATVIKRVAPQEAGAPRPSAVPEVGCQYDTQCKGDRICVKGECVAPTPSTPAIAPSS